MSGTKFSNTSITRYESLGDFKLLSLGSLSGRDWSSIVKEEIQAANNRPIEEEEPNFTDKVVLFGILVTLTLLGAGTWIQAPEIVQSLQIAGTNSVEQLILRD
jgi:hypothetical protein